MGKNWYFIWEECLIMQKLRPYVIKRMKLNKYININVMKNLINLTDDEMRFDLKDNVDFVYSYLILHKLYFKIFFFCRKET